MKYLCLCLTLVMLGGCATVASIDDHVDFDLASQATIYRDQWVRRGPPEVHVRPNAPASKAPTVLFIPFRTTQPMQQPGMIGYSVARNIYQTWASMQLFPAMEFSGNDTPYRRDLAVQLGRQRGADMVVGGFVTYVYAGGTAGDTQLAVQVEAHDVQSGQLVWSMAQSGLIPASKKNDYLLFATKSRLPSDPLYAITRVIAIDMGKHIQNWIAPQPPSGKRPSYDERVNDALFKERDPLPPPRTPRDETTNNRSF